MSLKLVLRCLLLTGWIGLGQTVWAACPAVLDFAFRPLGSEQAQKLCEHYAGKVILVVNTASFCGFTPQYEGLEALYARYRAQGLVVLGFPSNDFAQEPGSESDIKAFCELTYGVEFPMFEKVHVTGAKAHPFYQQLAQQSGQQPGWNFHKYLIDRAGQQIVSFATRIDPQDERLIRAIEEQL
ncbi:MAG: glutathione peroxidase [Candidatus Competibacteraceae bacterium]|nr:glutathione peroxidase [Candidatus Competibacteraceae bacterium]MCB1814142.1 glutathione peroxidase [Candidatus Competibacteraceae bacterium]